MKQKLFIIIITLISIAGYSQVDVPDAPKFESASVIPGTIPAQVELNWVPSDSIDVAGYYIYKVNDAGISNFLDTVYGRTTSYFIDSTSLANIKTETYRLAAFDTLDNISLLTAPHTTMYAIANYDKCALKINLNWNAYVAWENVQTYNIYRKKDDGNFIFIDSISGVEINYTDSLILPNQDYCYYIEAVRSDGIEASSNEICVFTNSHIPPSYINADYASVENNQIRLKFSVDISGEIIEYKIQRAIDTPANFTTIHTITDIESANLYYTDPNVGPEVTKYYYQLISIDPCGNVSAVSNHASNIILTGYSDEQLNHYLAWDRYESWQGNIASYQVVSIYGEDAENNIVTLYNEQQNQSISISDYVEDKHYRREIVPYEYCYYILAKEDASTNPLGIEGVSKSNIICVSHEPRVFLPNAFFPNSYNLENRIFRPAVSFAKTTDYQFTIYDRWGLELFKTTDQTKGWDGIIKNKKAPPGYYVYFIQYKDFNGDKLQKSGAFQLYNE